MAEKSIVGTSWVFPRSEEEIYDRVSALMWAAYHAHIKTA